MKILWTGMFLTGLFLTGNAQKQWDGGGGDNQWNSPANWFPDGVPQPTDGVILDNAFVNSSYTVLLPEGTAAVTLAFLHLFPSGANSILLHLPAGNTASPALVITGSGESLVLGNGSTLRNSSGAASGDVILLSGQMRINNNGRYLHNTPRGNAALIDKLSVASGTELGIFEFDVPGTAGYTVSLTGNTFGSLVFSATAAGGMKSYSGSGTSTMQINGNWIIQAGASLTSTLSANILLKGELVISGNLNLHPSTAGSTGRSIFFTGNANSIRGSGNLGMNANFRNLELFTGSNCTLMRDISLPQLTHTFLINSGAALHTGQYKIDGNGSFTLDTDATLGIGSADGISLSENSGNIRTVTRNFNSGSNYIYESDADQQSGTGLPSMVNILGVNKPGGKLQLSGTVRVMNALLLLSGNILSSAEKKLIFSGQSIQSPANQYGETNMGWEKSFIEGPLQWEISEAETVSLPVGKGDVFAPLILQKEESGFASYLVEYFPRAFNFLTPIASPPLDHISLLEHWTITSDAASINPSARVGISWRPASGAGMTEIERQDLRIAQWDDRGMGLRWEETGNAPSHIVNGNFGLIKSNLAINHFSVFTLASSSTFNILPIKNFRLYTKLISSQVRLEWTFDGVDSISHFSIERSIDGREFKSIGQLKKQAVQFHQFLDTQPNHGLNYYRIRVFPFSDSSYYSSISSLFYAEISNSIKLFPNPATDRMTLIFPEASSIYECLIVNTNGVSLEQPLKIQGKQHVFSVEHLSKGRYSLVIKHLNKHYIIPFIRR